MNSNQDDEFVAVRVQDPRIQNEGSWNSHVDFKIFLHTNSKAFTAKTSCVRRRYSEFVWLKKKMQKNAGLVPVPDLPGKSFFSFCNEDFLETRRNGLQAFLDKVVNMTVCLSDSQLHLFLQTQLPVGHILDCVQGHTPYSVTDAILTYASSNWGFAQAQEEDSIKEPSLTVSYESMESPAPHQPVLQATETLRPEPLSCGDSDPLADLLELRDKDQAELQPEEESSVTICQRSDHLEAVVECEATEATFYLGDVQDESLAEQTQQMSCQIQTPVEVHSPMGTGFQKGCEVVCELESAEEEEEERDVTLDTEEKTVCLSEAEVKTDQLLSPEEAHIENVACEPEQCINPEVILDFKDNDCENTIIGSSGSSQEEVLEVVCSERQVLENHVTSELNHADTTEGQVPHVRCEEESKKSDSEESSESESEEETTPQSEIHVETEDVKSVPEEDSHSAVQQLDQVEQEVDLVGTKDESDEDTHSLPSSNESIVKVSDEESICDDTEESIQAVNGFVKMSDVDASSRNILDLQMNGFPVEKDELHYFTPLDLNSTAADGDLTESGDFSVLESSCVPGAADAKCAEEETLEDSRGAGEGLTAAVTPAVHEAAEGHVL
ncbi:sorting nexin-11 isoform X1 [Hippoglossus hippoglossus]|uniref:sorting nexin-11 isoform X1 n=1 Tax=Hippoglossus hippoglossus TaxID=8267 RepID=UPI00148C4A41|nr:sorting nexin-11 isoform X1 [Hippoglossus hippoglossus]